MKRVPFLLATVIIFLGLPMKSYTQFDFGDAPDPAYPTLMINNGAYHGVGSIWLGNYIDVESDGQPSSLANGDDLSGFTDDEDGVFFSTWLAPGQTASVTVIASAPGFLDAWIDFNNDGDWIDIGEQILTSTPISSGFNSLNFNVPSAGLTGQNSFARFRVSSTGGLWVTGFSIDGEVEDYPVYLGSPPIGDTIMDIDVTKSYTQNEISMSVIQNTGAIVAAYNDEPWPGGPGIGVSISTDQGTTWKSQQLTIPTSSISGITFLDAFDPTVTTDDSGHIFIAHVSTDYNWGSGPESGLYVHKSTDGGNTWSAPYEVDIEPTASGSTDPAYRFNDRCQIRADRRNGSPYQGNIYLTWIKDRGWNMPSPNSDIYVSVSSDGGQSFSAALQVNATSDSLGNMPVQDVAANGDLYLLWMDYNVITGGNGVMLLNKSTDGGASWGNDIIVDTIPLPPLNLNSGSDARAKGAAVIRTHPSVPNKLYIVYAADPDGPGVDEADIFFIQSTDGGTNWSTPLRVNDDSTPSDQILPWMEVKSNGTIDIVWYDRRNDGGDLLWDVYATTSIDEGATFATNTQLNANAFPTPQNASGAWMGEYLGLAVHDSMAYVGFCSSLFDSKGDVVFTSFVNPSNPNSVDQPGKAFIDLKIYPNPAESGVTVELMQAQEVTISLYDLSGRLLYSKITGEIFTFIDLTTFSKGVYTVKINGDGQQVSKLLIKR